MKHPELIVKIPEPCHEDWNKMSPTEKGKFCQVCTKEVVDFTAKSDEEVLRYLSNNGNICGRFHGSQLNRTLIADRKKRNHWLSYAASLLLPMTLFSQETKISEQKTTNTEQIDTSGFKSLKISSLDRKTNRNTNVQNDSITVNGTITDDSGLPLPGASIFIKGTGNGTTADFDGNYKIKARKKDQLVFAYVGFNSKTIKIKESIINVQLDGTSCDFLGKVVTAGPNERYRSKFTKKSYSKTPEEINEREQRTQNYFAFQRKKWLDKRAKRREERQTKNNH
ncbi:carboxypeptidase-like regulatory domain-containing protein [uncultured Kordia sp.]|uniref:carboxypeptidase-like regulatory domain-containing protein n=1 Tax=uncultured Kordia sp. TaxID=507699 RepID=UPI0026292CAB|nr:carboxypeptidase-like regulatory domain-containing protein [uncultured Kordia sp.]